MKYVLVTGVSTGIGLASVEKLLQEGYYVFGNVRKAETGKELEARFPNNFQSIIFDVTDHKAISNSVDQVAQVVGSDGLYALINNAGIAVTGPLMHLTPERLRHQLEVNVIGVNVVTQTFLPLLGGSKDSPFPPGRIINMSSIAGRISLPFSGAYAASKHALEALSDAMRRELMIYNIKLVIIQPGPIETPIWYKAKEDAHLFDDTDYAPIIQKRKESMKKTVEMALKVDRVASLVARVLAIPNPKNRYVITPKKLMMWYLPRLMPDSFLDKWVKKNMMFIKD